MVDCIYICSAAHSGSTLLDLLLGSHSRVASLGEISKLPKNIALNTRCSCGKPVRSCSFWQEVLRIVGERIGVDIPADPYALNMGYPKSSTVVDKAHQTPAYLMRRKVTLALVYLQQKFGMDALSTFTKSFQEGLDNNLLVFDVVRKILGVNMIVDSSKSYLKAVGLYLKRPDKIRLIFLTRDGRGVMFSNLKRNRSRRHGLYHWKKYYSRSFPLFRSNVSEEHMLHVRYEDLASNSTKELTRICDFLGIQFEASMLDYASHVHHITNGNNMRFSKSSTISLDISWHDKLSESDQHYFERKAGRLNRQLGYE